MIIHKARKQQNGFFSSCTTSLSALESDLYLGNVGSCTLFATETFNIRTIRAHSHFQVEDKILFLAGTEFETKFQLHSVPDLRHRSPVLKTSATRSARTIIRRYEKFEQHELSIILSFLKRMHSYIRQTAA